MGEGLGQTPEGGEGEGAVWQVQEGPRGQAAGAVVKMYLGKTQREACSWLRGEGGGGGRREPSAEGLAKF